MPKEANVTLEPLYISVNDAVKRYSIGRTNLYEILSLPDCPKVYKLGSKSNCKMLIPVREFDEFFKSLLTVR